MDDRTKRCEACGGVYWADAHKCPDPTTELAERVARRCGGAAPLLLRDLEPLSAELRPLVEALEAAWGVLIDQPCLENCSTLINVGGLDPECDCGVQDAFEAVETALAAARSGKEGACEHTFEVNYGMYDSMHPYCSKCGRAQ